MQTVSKRKEIEQAAGGRLAWRDASSLRVGKNLYKQGLCSWDGGQRDFVPAFWRFPGWHGWNHRVLVSICVNTVLCKCFSRPENSCWIISATRRDVGINSVWLWAAETLFLDYNLRRNGAGISRLGDKDLMGKAAVSMQWFTRPEYSIEYLWAWLKGFKWF